MTRSVNFPLLGLAAALLLSVSGKLPDDVKPNRLEVYGGGKIFDISHRYTPEMPAWESKEGLSNHLRLIASMKNGSFANVSEMKLSVHSGTHVDAPGHFIDEYYDAGFDSDSLDLQTLNGDHSFFFILKVFIFTFNFNLSSVIGPALLVDVPRDKNITGEFMSENNCNFCFLFFN